MMYELIATTTFGLEAVCRREIEQLGYEVKSTENGKITYMGDERAIVNSNLWLRTADRVLIKIAEFKALTFDQLFDQSKSIQWKKYISKNGKFVVNGKSVKSKLFHVTTCQKMVKKAIVDNLKEAYHVDWLDETEEVYPISVSLLKDVATITLDTSGAGLHKRGYRIRTVEAPMKETLAAGLVLLSYWSKDRVLYDVFCGSGTIPIEAAMIGRNIAPGLSRDFSSKHWTWISKDIWKEETRKAYQAMDNDIELKIYGSDVDAKSIEAAIENAEEAGVDDCIEFKQADFKEIEYENNYSIVISNPPYGERLDTVHIVKGMYIAIGNIFRRLDTWSSYFITSFEEFERVYGKKADRNRVLYNGKIKARYYQYYGPRPPVK